MNTKPEFITCLHEEISVAMAHGYAKIAGKPMSSLVHGVVGTQHAAMRSTMPIATRRRHGVIAGNVGEARSRRPGVEWAHSAHDQATIVRDYVKWDDQANNLQDFRRRLGPRLRPRDHRADGPCVCRRPMPTSRKKKSIRQNLIIPQLRKRSQPWAMRSRSRKRPRCSSRRKTR
jgi:hypothetical protein